MDVFLSNVDVVPPDVLVVLRRGRARLADEGIHGPPDLVVEIISPSSETIEMHRQCPLDARQGVRELWLIDPVSEQVHRYDFSVEAARPVRVVAGNEKLETPLLPGLVIAAAELFSGGFPGLRHAFGGQAGKTKRAGARSQN